MLTSMVVAVLIEVLVPASDRRRVVVKVQRPGVDEAVYRDLDILGRLARTAEKRTDWATGMGLSGIVRDFSERTREELDYRLEAANMAAAALALEDEALIAVPAAVDGLCSRRVLVQEKAEGASVGRAGALARLMGRAIGPDGRLVPVLFGDALTVFGEVGLRLPQSTATLIRTLATLMGTLEVISPGYALAVASALPSQANDG